MMLINERLLNAYKNEIKLLKVKINDCKNKHDEMELKDKIERIENIIKYFDKEQ